MNTPEGGYYKQEKFTNSAIKKFLHTYGYIVLISIAVLLYGIREVRATVYNLTSVACSLDNVHSGDSLGFQGGSYRVTGWTSTGDMIFAEFTQNN